MKAPIKYFGGKNRMINNLMKLFPVHKQYVDVCGGSGAVLFAKPYHWSKIETYNDYDETVVNFYRVLRDKQKFEKFKQQISLIPYSHAERTLAFESKTTDDIEKAINFFICARMGFSGKVNSTSFGYSIAGQNKIAPDVAAYLSAIDLLLDIHLRLRIVQIENRDFRFILDTHDLEDTLFYIDPPYISETRTPNSKYKYEMSIDDHEELVSKILKLKGMVILSGYKHDIYKPLEKAGWERKDFKAHCFAIGRTKKIKQNDLTERGKRIESVWLNPNTKKNQKRMELF